MADDLPNRPKPSGAAHKPIDPKERVKSVSDKEDPRFAAAREKADKEERLRAAQAARKVDGDTGATPAEPEDDGDEDGPKGSFSFNMTTEKDES